SAKWSHPKKSQIWSRSSPRKPEVRSPDKPSASVAARLRRNNSRHSIRDRSSHCLKIPSLYLTGGFQFSRSVMGEAEASPVETSIRKRPSGATSYCWLLVELVPPPQRRV